MKKVLVFAGSNNKTSINKQLAIYASSLLKSSENVVVDLNDYLLPIYGIDIENEAGIPDNAQKFNKLLLESDGIILSLAEHNGSYAAVFKNLFDWLSRTDKEVWKNKPMLLMSTSPGGRGGAGVLSTAKSTFPHLGGNIVSEFSLPSFFDNFKNGTIVNSELENQLTVAVSTFETLLA